MEKYFFINGVQHESRNGEWVKAEDVDELVLGHLAAQHLAAIVNTRLRADLKRARTCLADILTWHENGGFIGGVHYDEQSIADSIREVLWIGLRCGKCHRPMRGTAAYDGACACGGLIENAPDTEGGNNDKTEKV